MTRLKTFRVLYHLNLQKKFTKIICNEYENKKWN